VPRGLCIGIGLPTVVADLSRAATHDDYGRFELIRLSRSARPCLSVLETTLGKKALLFAESQTRFFLKATNLDLEFVPDDTGAMSYLFMYQGGTPRLAIRK
jgi:hypothetical protein